MTLPVDVQPATGPQVAHCAPRPCAKATRFLNLVFYQVGWFACVLGVAWDLQSIGVTIAVCLVGIHFYLATDRSVQIPLAFAAATVGLLIDSAQLWIGVFSFPRGTIVAWLPPPFMPVLWLQFATTLRYGCGWLSERYRLAACFGLAGAPLAFFAGERLGAIEVLSPRSVSFGLLGLLWSLAVPLLVRVADRLAARAAVTPDYRWPRQAL
jgi:hypothetical protein